MDLREFTDVSFDPGHWINGATESIVKEDDREKTVMTLIAKLQVYFHQLNTDFESTAQNVVQNLPKVMRDTEKLIEDSSNLQDKMTSVKEEIEKIKSNTGLTITSLEKIDRVKMELLRYKEALHEADKWTVLSNDIKGALDVGDIEIVISKVITMQKSLSVLTKAHDYEDKKLELESFKNQLEAVTSPLLLQAFTSKSIEESRKYVQVFQEIERLPQLLKLYSQNQKSLLIQSWDVISEIESDENIIGSLQNYYSELLLTWQEQMKLCTSILPQLTGTEVLLDLYKDLLIAISQRFSKYIENNLKQVSEPLNLLLNLKICTQNFALNLKSLINSVPNSSNEKVLNLARAIYLPYKIHISKYGLYQEAALHPHLMRLKSSENDIMESVHNLSNNNSKAFSCLEDANKFCVNLTESCGYHGFFKAAECFLNGYLDQYRSIKKNVIENREQLEEVSVFQMCLTVLQCIGNFLNKLQQFDRECVTNLKRAKTKYRNPDIHPFCKYPSFFLDETGQKEFQCLLDGVSEMNDLAELKPIFNSVQELSQDVYNATYHVIFEPISTFLATVCSTSLWESKKGSASDLPDYSFVPQEYITQIGQYLMNLPQLLEPFLLSKNPELVLALSMVGSEYTALADSAGDESTFAEIFLGQIAKGTCKAYVKQILAIHELSSTASKQLSTDINYLGNILEDLGFGLTKKLQDIVLLLKLTPSEYGPLSSGCSPQTVAAVRQMRNIVSG